MNIYFKVAAVAAAGIFCCFTFDIAQAEFRHQGPNPDNDSEVYTFAWGTSVGGAYVAGEANVEGCSVNTIRQGPGSVCTMAVVWSPSFDEGPGVDDPFILPVLTAGLPTGRDRYWSQARAIDADGDTIVGRDQFDYFVEDPPGSFTNDGPRFRAVVWTRNANAPWSNANARVTELKPHEDFDFAGARGVSDDGKFAVGWNSQNNLDGFINTQAALWVRTGANSWDAARRLYYLTDDDDDSVANGVAVDDGGNPVVVGWSGRAGSERHVIQGSDEDSNLFSSSFNPHAFVWTQETGMKALLSLSGEAANLHRSEATAISADTSTVVGWSERPARSDGQPYLEAVRWTRSGSAWSGAQGLGVFDLPESLAATVASDFSDEIETRPIIPLGSVALGVSERGKGIAGYQTFGYETERGGDPLFRLAYVWSEEHGKQGQYLGDVLKAEGVDIGSWILFTATAVREQDDFFIISGDGSNTGEIRGAPLPGFIARLGRDPGFTTLGEQAVSFSGISTTALAVSNNIGATLTGLNEMAENHRCIRPEDQDGKGWCFFTFGTAGVFNGDDIDGGGQFAGDVGLAHYFTPLTSAGVSIGAGQADTDLLWDGNYRSDELHVGGYLAHMPGTGVRLFGAGLWGDLSDVEIARGYLNGVDLTHSFGDTEGEGWGVLGRVGYGMRASEQTLITPFVQLSYTDAHIDGYRETGGPFPVTFQDIDTNTTVGQIGVMEETDVSETITVFGSIAWAQVLDADNPEVRGAVLDIFEVSSDGAGNIDGWAEFMGGARYQVSQAGVVSVSGRVSTEFEDFATLNGRIGYSQTF